MVSGTTQYTTVNISKGTWSAPLTYPLALWSLLFTATLKPTHVHTHTCTYAHRQPRTQYPLCASNDLLESLGHTTGCHIHMLAGTTTAPTMFYRSKLRQHVGAANGAAGQGNGQCSHCHKLEQLAQPSTIIHSHQLQQLAQIISTIAYSHQPEQFIWT